MKKTMIFAGMLSIGYAYAQRGNVGINTTSPNATLEVKVADINANNDTNQGMLIPKLTKTRVAAIADGKLVKGTLVFVEGATYSGTNTKVADINDDGFYYYNGTKWVRVEGSVLPSGNANGQVLKWNGSAWIASTDDNTNIYTNDGTLPTNRTVDLNAKTLGLNSGVVSINSGDTWAPLRIHSTYSNGAIIALSNNNWDERVQLANTAGDFSVWSNGITHFSIKKNTGNVGLGLLNPTAKLDVNGDARIRTLPAGATTDQIVTTDTNGNLRKLPLSSIDTNTTYSAGTGLTLSGTTFSVNPAGIALGGDVTGNANDNKVTKIQGRPVDGVTVPTAGQVLKWIDNQWKPANDNIGTGSTTYTAGNGLTLTGTEFSLPVNTSGTGNVVTGITQTANGITVTKANVVDTNTTYTAGNGLTLSGTEFSLPVNTSGTGNVVTGITQTANGITVTKGNVNFTDTNTNIYTNDGTLSTTRNVNLAGNNLNFNSGVVELMGSNTWAPLRVSSTDTNGAYITLSHNNWNERTEFVNHSGNFRILNNGFTRFSIDKTSGNVAIGGETPTAKLDVVGNARIRTLPAGAATDQVVTADNNGNLRKLPLSSIDTNTTYTAGNGLTLSGTQFSVPVTINGTGSIVTDVVQTTNGITVTKGNPNITDTSIYSSNGTITSQRDVGLTGNFLNFNNGYVQVNSTNGLFAPLRVNSSHSEGAIMLLHPNNTNNQVHVRATTSGDAVLTTNGGGYLWVAKNSGNVGIGTSTPTAKLDVAGDIRTNAVIYNSDARLKKGVQNIANATATVNNLRSVTYHWNEAGKKKGGNDELQYGFIAQEVEKVLPSLVTTDSESYKSVNYVAVVPVLVKALQEKDEEVKKLQSEMEQMKKEVEQIKQLLKK